MIRYALIMAAGRGMRLMPLTQYYPKSMVAVDGQSLVSISLRQIVTRIPNIGITVGYKGAMLASHAIQEGVSMIFNTEGRGNSWWLFNTLMQFVDEPVLTLTCDNIVNLDLEFIASEYCRLGQPACMLVPVTPVEGIEGDYIIGEEHRVCRLSRKESSFHYCSGIQLLNPCKIKALLGAGDDFLEVWSKLIDQEQLYFSKDYPYQWYSVNTLEQLNRVLHEPQRYHI